MVRGKNQRLKFKRRRSAETDYRRRLKLLRAGQPRAVVRVTNRQVICQLVGFEVDGDRVITEVSGKTLIDKYGWPSDVSRKSVPACYLAGFALAKKAAAAGIDSAILDIGLAASTRGNRAFSALKGMLDGGMELPHGESILPDEGRINGAHINDSLAAAVAATKTKIEEAKV